MQSSLLALALVSVTAASAASAQTRVELYGVLDGGVQSITRADIDGVKQHSSLGLTSSFNWGNRIGLRGSEDLGGGNQLVFTLENGFQLDTGALASRDRLFNRQAYLGLQNALGTVAFGRFGTPGSTAGNFDMFWQADPFEGGYGDAGMVTFANYWTLDNAVVVRSANMNGLIGSAMYSFSMDGQEQPGSGSNNRFAALGANYSVGKLWSALIYETKLAADGSGEDETIFKAALNYDFGPVKPFLAFSRADNYANYGQSSDSNTWLLGLTAPLAGGLVRASWQYLDGKEKQLAAGTFAAEREVWSLGYSYHLSKRTIAWGVASHSSGDKSLDKNSQAGYVMAADRQDVNRSMLTLGLTHSF